MAKQSKFKKRIIREYLQLTSKILNTVPVVDESNYFVMTQNIEREIQKMIGRLKYRD